MFHDETFLKKFLNDSLSQESHLKSLMWSVSQPIGLEPLSRKPITISNKLEPIKLIRAMKAGFNSKGILFLTFDSGIRRMVESIPFMFKDRKKRWRPCYRFGWAGQYAFTQYLNFFAPQSDFTFQFDNVFSTPFNLEADVHVNFPNYDFWIEIKTALPKRSVLRYYINKYNPYPKWVICVVSLNESLTYFAFYGFCKGSDVKKLDLLKVKGKACH